MSFSKKYNVPEYKRLYRGSNNKSLVKVDETVVVDRTGESDLNDYWAFVDLILDADNELNIVFRDGSGHNNVNDGNIVLMKSNDGGAGYTWDSPTIIVPHGDRMITNPAITIDSTGRITIFFGIQPTGTRQAWYVFSEDGGSTWSDEIRITEDFPSGQITSPQKAIEIDGYLYRSFYARTGSSGSRKGVIYRKAITGDFSVQNSWTVVTPDMYPTSAWDGEEPGLLLLNNGAIGSLVRSDPTSGVYWTWSPNNCVNWSKPEYAFPSIGKAPLMQTPAGTIVTMGRSITGSGASIYGYSTDNGRTWITDRIDSRDGKYLYGGGVWHPQRKQVILIYSVEVGATNFGATAIVCARFNEI